MAVQFHSLQINFNLKSKKPHKSWIKSCIEQQGRSCGEISFIFTSNLSLREMNREYLNHDYFTDVITFDYSEDDLISGDVFISIDQVRINAETFKAEMDDELRRVMIHGVLHLLGFKDSTDEEKSQMRKLENDALHLWSKGE